MKKDRKKLHISLDNLAVPEVETGLEEEIEEENAPRVEEEHSSIEFDSLAVPEIHYVPKKKP